MLNVELFITSVANRLAMFFSVMSQKCINVAVKHQEKTRAEFEKRYGFDPLA